MSQPSSSLKVFLYQANGNPSALRALRTRLEDENVKLTLADPSMVGQIGSRESALRDAVWGSEVVLIALFGEEDPAALHEIGVVVNTTRQKPQGEFFVLPLRFKNCDLPEVLKRWQPVDLFEENGYEKLMLALKMRTERLDLTLNPRPDWSLPLRWTDEEASLQDKSNSLVTILTIGVAVLMVAILSLWGFRIFKAVTTTPVSVNMMVQNSTQSAAEDTRNRSMTQTTVVQTVRAPITQTAVMEEALRHPATSTLQLPTIIALPTEIMDPGNVRLVYVPGDNFMIGNEFDASGENPVHTVYVKPFYIDKYEVTNTQYQLCVGVGVCEPPMSVNSQTRPEYYGNVQFNEYPVINVTWNMARQYCEWRGARLPSEAEWEKAARSIDGRTYPWGEADGCSFANYSDASGVCAGDTTAVGSYPDGRSLYGAFDMSGNVLEWVNSLYWAYPYVSADGRESTATTGLRVVRGGSWGSSLDEITTYYRFGIDPSASTLYTGFRCAHDASL